MLLVLLLIWWINRPAGPKVLTGNDRFGLCFISAPDHLADDERYRGALAAGAGWDRWPLYWHWVDAGGYVGDHPGGSHDYDTLVAQELAHGLTPVVILLGTPARHAKTLPAGGEIASSPPPADPAKPNNLPILANTPTLPPASLAEPIFADGSDSPGPGKTINPANAWAAFVFTTVDRYRPQGQLARQLGWPRQAGVRYWEVWNEPDYHLFWAGDVAEYYRLLEVAYKSIKTADPAATVLLGGLAFYDQRAWFPELLRQTGGQPERAYFDVFSFHHYVNIYQSEWLIQQARASLEAYGLADRPIWITESGLSVWDDYPATAYDVSPTTPYRGSMVEQAAYVLENSALAFYNGVERYYHFMLHDDCGDSPSSAYGLRQNFTAHPCNPAEGQPRPAYAAYQLAAEQFRDLVPLWRQQQHDQDQVAFYRPADRSRLVVLWARQGLTVTTSLTATGETARLYWIEPTETVSGTTGLSRTVTLTPTNGLYNLTLRPATNQNSSQPDDRSYQVGGPPLILVEADTVPPETRLQPLPATSPPNLVVHWQGEDFGSGLAGYDIYVSRDGGPLELWLDNTAQTEAKFAGEVGHTYSFAGRGRDRAGNEAPQPAQPQVTTQIVSGAPVMGVVVGPGGEPVAQASVTISGPNTQEIVVTDETGRWLPVSLLPGEYTVQASAPGYGSWPAPRRIGLNQTARAITTTLPPAINAVASGDFEDSQVWQVWQWEGQIVLSGEAFDGQAAARLGDGRGEPTPCPAGQPGQVWLLRQQVSIPVDPAAVLSFLYQSSSMPLSGQNGGLKVLLIIDGQSHSLFTPSELGPASEWVLASKDLSPWPGQLADLEFRVVRCSDEPFAVNLDRISIGPNVTP